MTFATLLEVQTLAAEFGASASDVTAALHNFAWSTVCMMMRAAECTVPSVADDYGILKHAEMCYVLELLGRAGKISVTTGEIRKQTQGRVTTEMQNWYPMFFFGGADSSMRGESITSLLQHATFWQLGGMFVNLYCDGGVTSDEIVQLGSDNNTRGYQWWLPEYDPLATFY